MTSNNVEVVRINGHSWWAAKSVLLMMMVMCMACTCARGDGELQTGFYNTSCPDLQNIVYNGMRQAVAQERRMAASILRLFFHDCFVQGCDASILLDDDATAHIKSEKGAAPNLNSVRGFEVIDNIKADVEDACPQTVSCADILALAARDGIVLSGGAFWNVPLGRRDARTAGFDEANKVLPSPFMEVSDLLASFQSHGLTTQDLVTLSGAHTFGRARCLFFKNRLYNLTGDGNPDATMNKYYLRVLQDQCPQSGGDENLTPLDPYTPFYFDNRYFTNLVYGRGLFLSDQTLFSATLASTTTQQLVRAYSQNPRLFLTNFVTSILKLGNIHPLTGSQGEIRQNCHSLN